MKRVLVLILAIFTFFAMAQSRNAKRPSPVYPALTGSEQIPAAFFSPTFPESPTLDETDLIGDTITVGTTWYDVQHNGTCGRMCTREANGWRQFVWMKGENQGASVRHVWWNGIDPNGVQVYPGTGVAVESSTRAGYVTLDIGSNGAGFPAYHNMISGVNQTAISMDLIPHAGAFLDFQAPPVGISNPVIWPKVQIGQNQRIHMVSTENSPAAGNPKRQYYTGATYDPISMMITFDRSWTLIDWTQTIAADVATSPVPGSNKTLWAWTRSREYTTPDPSLTYTQINNDIYYLIDVDGLNPNFNLKVNLTNFTTPDTLRAYTCLSAFIDHNNYAHIAFTTRSYFQLQGQSYWNASLIWHWSEQYPDSFRIIGSEEYFAHNNNLDCGAWNVKVQRPSLGQDPSTRYLYCVYQVFDTDTMHIPPNCYPSGEIYVSISTDGGLHWSQETNITETITHYSAPYGQHWSEICPTLAKRVDGFCHIEYVLDTDVRIIIPEQPTINPVRYHRVPVNLIPTTPLVEQTKQLHVEPPPPIHVMLNPLNPPITIPANGGSFSFNATVIRYQSPASPFWVYTRNRFPDGHTTGYLMGPVQINLPVGIAMTRQRLQMVPSSWPAGQHTYIASVDTDLISPSVDADSFSWTKLTSEDGNPWIADSTCTGETFPGEVGEIVSSGSGATPTMGIFPNPFNATTAISYELQAASYVSLKLYDPAGRLVASLVEEWREAGSHKAIFDGSELPSGVYFYQFQAGTLTHSGKMLLVK